MKKGDTVTLRLEKFADRGKSLARLDGYVVFVAGAVPGDLVEARIFKRRKSFAEGRLTKVLEPSTLRTDPVCQYFAACGGCKWQHVEYGAQLDAKQQSVHEALMHAGGFEGVEVLPTIAANPIYRYRNKMEFSFSAFRWLTDWEIASGAELDKSFAAGLHVPGRFDKVLDLTACFLMPEVGVRVLNATRAFAKQHGWTPWNVRTHEGYLRNLMLRMPVFEDELMVALTTSADMPERAEQLAEHYQATIPEITTFVNVINPTIGQTPYGAQTNVLFGPGVVHDRIGPHRFEIGPSAFFQTNSRQAEVLYDVAREYAQLKPTDLLYDLYCGAGTISMYMADAVERVVGVELVEEAVRNAKANALANGVDNCTFVAGDMKSLFNAEFVEAHGRPDVLIVDPPRAGMHPKVVKHIGRLRPERFVYVSCNPQTQATDLSALADVYEIERVQPVDLFPHTHHIESVAQLRRRDG